MDKELQESINILNKQTLKGGYAVRPLNTAIQIVLDELNILQEYNEVLLEKLMFALTPTQHQLDDVTKEKFQQIISENLDLETKKITEKLKIWWECGKYE